MLVLAIALFFFAILLGLYLLSFVIQDKGTPKAIVFTHGPLAVTALVLLIIYAFYHRPAPLVSLVLFILAATGGLTLFYKDMTGKPLPKWLAFGHGLTAFAAFVFLIIYAFS